MTQTTEIISKIDLFPFYRAFFCSDGTWEKLTDRAKMTYIFPLYRLLSIKYPEYIQNLNKIHSVQVLDALHNAFKGRGKQPGWAYTKAGKTKDGEDLLKKYPEYLIQQFIKHNNIEKKSFDFLVEMHPEEVVAHLETEMKVLNQKPKKTKR